MSSPSPSFASNRRATVTRNTRETQITLTIDLDTPGEISLASNLPFLDHMMNTFAVHGRFGLAYQATGDIHVDPHHLVEDMGITLGMAISQALGTFNGIQRAGFFMFPMDKTLASVALDLCGRPNLVWHMPLRGQLLGTLDPTLFYEFYKGLVDALRLTLHVNVTQPDNDHHAVEAVFKAFSRAMHSAVQPLPFDSTAVLSTKGTLNA